MPRGRPTKDPSEIVGKPHVVLTKELVAELDAYRLTFPDGLEPSRSAVVRVALKRFLDTERERVNDEIWERGARA